MRKDDEETKILSDWSNVVCNYRGEIFCRCPAGHYGLWCQSTAQGSVSWAVRIPPAGRWSHLHLHGPFQL